MDMTTPPSICPSTLRGIHGLAHIVGGHHLLDAPVSLSRMHIRGVAVATWLTGWVRNGTQRSISARYCQNSALQRVQRLAAVQLRLQLSQARRVASPVTRVWRS